MAEPDHKLADLRGERGQQRELDEGQREQRGGLAGRAWHVQRRRPDRGERRRAEQGRPGDGPPVHRRAAQLAETAAARVRPSRAQLLQRGHGRAEQQRGSAPHRVRGPAGPDAARGDEQTDAQGGLARADRYCGRAAQREREHRGRPDARVDRPRADGASGLSRAAADKQHGEQRDLDLARDGEHACSTHNHDPHYTP
jgi:hypothetical protein